MVHSFTNDPPIFRHLIFPSFDWKDLIASKWKFTLASENKLPVWLDVEHAGSTCWLDKVFEFSVGQLEDLLNRQAACLALMMMRLTVVLGTPVICQATTRWTHKST